MERGNLAQALDCLQHAYKLAPHEDYILKHMKIVQHRLTNLKLAPDTNRQKNIAFAKYDPKEFGGPPVNENARTNAYDHVDDLIAKIPDRMPADDMQAILNQMANDERAMPNHVQPEASSNENQKSPDKSTMPLDASESINNDQQIINNVNNKRQTDQPNGNVANIDAGERMPSSPSAQQQRRGIIDHDTERYQQYARAGESRYHSGGRAATGHRRYHKQQYIHDNSIPVFAHDMDDPSSGTS